MADKPSQSAIAPAPYPQDSPEDWRAAMRAELGLPEVAASAPRGGAGIVDCLCETWVVARIDRALTADEERAVLAVFAPLGRDLAPEVWVTRPEAE